MKDTLVAGDVHYLRFYLQELNRVTGEISYFDLTNATLVKFRLRKVGSSSNAIDITGTIENATLGLVKFLVTVPLDTGDYKGEIEVSISGNTLTWKDIYYEIEEQLG